MVEKGETIIKKKLSYQSFLKKGEIYLLLDVVRKLFRSEELDEKITIKQNEIRNLMISDKNQIKVDKYQNQTLNENNPNINTEVQNLITNPEKQIKTTEIRKKKKH